MNHEKYLQQSPMVGFTESVSYDAYTIGERVTPITYRATCLNFPVEVTVATAMVKFKGFEIACAVTTEVRVGHLLSNGGFGSHAYFDESKVMEAAIATYCERHGYAVCKKVCSWPYAVAMITNFGKGFVGIEA